MHRARTVRLADYPAEFPMDAARDHVGYGTGASLPEQFRSLPQLSADWSARLQFKLARTWLKLHFPGRAFITFAHLAAFDDGHHLTGQFTATELTSMARAAGVMGRGSEAKDILRLLIAKAPQLPAPRIALAGFLLETHSYRYAEAVASSASRQFSSDTAFLLLLARIQSQLRRFDEASETLERILKMDSAHAWAWFEYGKVARESRDDSGFPTKAFQRAGALAGNDAGLLEMVARQFADDLDYGGAVLHYERLFAVDHLARKRPATLRLYAMALNGCGRPSEAHAINKTALRNCRILAKLRSGDAWDYLKREESLLLLEVGRKRESEQALRSIRRRRVDQGPRYDRPEYLPETEPRLRELRQIIGARDVVILLQGPSFTDFASRIDDFAKFDFAIATLGAFPPIERVLSQINRLVDILLVTNPSIVRSWYPEFSEFLSRKTRNLVLTTRYALSGVFEFGTTSEAFMARHDERLLLAHPLQGPPLPSKPLHFEGGNSLTLLLPLLLIGRPRRVFIFGADGGANPNFCKRPYFYYDDYDTRGPDQSLLSRPDLISFQGRPDRLQEANRRFHADAVNADRIIGAAMRSLTTLFDVPIPPIFNVCPHSTHRLFERLNIESALDRLAQDD